MFKISDFLERYKNLGLNERLSRETLVKKINQTLGYDAVFPEHIKISGSVAKVHAPSAVRSEIVLKKKEILEKGAAELGSAFLIKDIR